MTFLANVKTQLIEQRLNTSVYEYFWSELVKLILYGHMRFKNDSVPLNFYHANVRVQVVLSSGFKVSMGIPLRVPICAEKFQNGLRVNLVPSWASP